MQWCTYRESKQRTDVGNRTYKAIADAVGKNGYRGDLNQSAVARASAILDSQRPKKDTPEKKTRGSKKTKTEA